VAAVPISSALLLVRALRPAPGEPFATREQLQRSLSLFVPTVVMAVAMPFLGVYLTAAVYLAFMARRYGQFRWSRATALGVGTALVLFAIFELWFGVPLAKGPIEAWLGF
jgi:putative tricarboxylic transport membrane protein